MPVPTYYIETSVWGSLAPRQPRDRRRIVLRLLQLLSSGRGTGVVSFVVLDEIERASAAEAAAILHHLDLARPFVLPEDDRVPKLARAYVDANVLPGRREADALHVANSTIFGLDFLVSWNHRHLTRPTKKLQFAAVNQASGFMDTRGGLR